MHRLGGATSGQEHTEHSKHSCVVLCFFYDIGTLCLDIDTISNFLFFLFSFWCEAAAHVGPRPPLFCGV